MNEKPDLLATIDRGLLTRSGLRIAPSQVWGGVRLVPLVRANPRQDLRLTRRGYDEDLAVVDLGGHDPASPVPNINYASYAPHGMVVQWTKDGTPAATCGAQLFRKDGKRLSVGPFTARVMSRMAKREYGKNRLRFLPLHLAMEGFLALHFGGPDVAFEEYSRRALSGGLDPRWEMVFGGAAIHGLEDALRVFEIHEGQCGVLICVADALATAFVVPHPDDYRALHRTLLKDFFGELINRYSISYADVGRFAPDEKDPVPKLIDDLRALVVDLREGWEDALGSLTLDLFDRDLRTESVYRMNPFSMQRFITELARGTENHIGEAIVSDDGTLQYLKTFRLSAGQSRRAYLLSELAAARWSLEDAAKALTTTKDHLILRIEKAGLGYLIAEHVLARARKMAGR
ncbi:MAG: hypothetical protein AAF628_37875 [Planctomycetota bacterium]